MITYLVGAYEVVGVWTPLVGKEPSVRVVEGLEEF